MNVAKVSKNLKRNARHWHASLLDNSPVQHLGKEGKAKGANAKSISTIAFRRRLCMHAQSAIKFIAHLYAKMLPVDTVIIILVSCCFVALLTVRDARAAWRVAKKDRGANARRRKKKFTSFFPRSVTARKRCSNHSTLLTEWLIDWVLEVYYFFVVTCWWSHSSEGIPCPSNIWLELFLGKRYKL